MRLLYDLLVLGLVLGPISVKAPSAPAPTLSAEANFWWQKAKEDVKRTLDFPYKNQRRAKNVIFFLGDGMGQNTLSAARALKAHDKGKLAGEETLFVDSFIHTGYSRTYNADLQVPDSAGTATAYQCGVKANYGTLGIDERVPRYNCSIYRRLWQENPRSVDLKCIAHYAKDAGKGVGIVTNQPVTDASPTPMYGHVADRGWQSDVNLTAEAAANGCIDLARQFVEIGQHIDLSLTGGFANFDGARRNDGRNLYKEWVQKKKNASLEAIFINNRADLLSLDMKKYKAVLGLFSDWEFGYSKWRNEQEPTLQEMTRRAIEFMQTHHSEKGYHLFIEGGLIDYGHHSNLGAHALFDTLAFDNSIEVARNMTSPDDTLIVVTADHSHVFAYSGYAHRRTNILDLTRREKSLDGKPYTSILYANGPGYYANLRNFTKDNRTYEARADLSDPKENFNFSNYAYQYFSALPLKWEAHGGEDVPVYAHGPGSHQFIGVHEQNALAHLVYCAACFGPYHPDCPCDGNLIPPSPDSSGPWRAATIALSVVSGLALLGIVGLVLVFFFIVRPRMDN